MVIVKVCTMHAAAVTAETTAVIVMWSTNYDAACSYQISMTVFVNIFIVVCLSFHRYELPRGFISHLHAGRGSVSHILFRYDGEWLLFLVVVLRF